MTKDEVISELQKLKVSDYYKFVNDSDLTNFMICKCQYLMIQ